MKYLAVLLLCGVTFGQDWKPCTDFTNQFKQQVEKFNAEHKDGFSVVWFCSFSGDPSRVKKPEIRVQLSADEKRHLRALGKVADAAFASMGEYESYLFRAHRIRRPELMDPCYFYAGIRVGDDYISVDPNPMMALPVGQCPVVNWSTAKVKHNEP